MTTISLREAGSQIYVGYAQEQGQFGDVFLRILGPLTICTVNATVEHNNGKEPVVNISYKLNAVDTSYRYHVCFDTLEEAIQNAQKQRQEILDKRTVAKAA